MTQYTPPGTINIAVVGAHLEGGPLHHQLANRKASFVTRTRTARCYRFYALATEPPKPGLVRVSADDERAGEIELEVWALTAADFGEFVDAIPSPLAIGRVVLADGSDVAGFLCEPIAVDDSLEITSWGGWRAYRRSLGDRW